MNNSLKCSDTLILNYLLLSDILERIWYSTYISDTYMYLYIIIYNILHRITVVYSGSLVLETWYVVVCTRGFLPDWLHSICSADKDAVSFCEILVPEAPYLIDFTVYAVQTKMRCRFVMQAVAASLTDRWSMLSSASTLIPGTCSEQREPLSFHTM